MGSNILFWYVLVGIIYTLINGFVRKLDTDGDMMIVFVWIFMWPIAFLALIIRYLITKRGDKL